MSNSHGAPEPITRLTVAPSSPPNAGPSTLLPQLMMSPNPSESILFVELQPAQPPSDRSQLRPDPKSPLHSSDELAPPYSVDFSSPVSTLSSSSPYIDAWNHLAPLISDNPSKIDEDIVNEALQDRHLDFFLPQLCLLIIYRRSVSSWAEHIILDRCAKSLHFALRCIFYLGALGVTREGVDPALSELVENYRYACQLAYINGVRPILLNDASPIENNGSTEATIMDDLEQPLSTRTKDLRFKYLSTLKRFAKELSEIGSNLPETGDATRPGLLREKISSLNEQIRLSAIEPQSSRYAAGLFLPFYNGPDDHYAIVRVPEHEATILASRNRVPFSICLETISLPNSPSIFSSNLDRLVPEYAEMMEIMTLQNSRPTAKSPPVSNSPRTISGSSGEEGLALYMAMRRSQSPTIPISRSLDELVTEDTPLHQLKHMLQVPQNANSVKTKERWVSKEARIRAHSIYGSHEGWKLRSVIVKYGADGLQEQLALHLVQLFASIFESTGLQAKIMTYDAVALDSETSLIEPLLNAESIHQIKKNNNNISLHDYFVKKWNGPDSNAFRAAQRNFMRTLAGTSLVSYILQLKDRHNGNIMIDDDGNVVHIDWGFLLWNSPGAIGFETAPFKLTSEMVSVLGGENSSIYIEFKAAFHEAYLELRRHAKQIIQLVKLMFLCDSRCVPCAAGGQSGIDAIQARFLLNSTEAECLAFTNDLISQSYNNWRTLNYDYYQYYTNGILS